MTPSSSTRMYLVRLVLRSAVAVVALACGGSDGGRSPTQTPPPTVQPTMPTAVPGTLTIRLVTPNTDDGAIILDITGPTPVGDIASMAPGALVQARANGNTTRVAVFGPLAAGAVVRFSVPDVNAAQQYGAQVIEASDRGSTLRTSITGYQLTVAP